MPQLSIRMMMVTLTMLAALIGLGMRAQSARDKTQPTTQGGLTYVVMTTSLGDIAVELDGNAAPISVANFLSYVDKGEYDGTIFHRVIAKFVVQGGGFSPDFKELKSGPKIANEWRNGLKNVRGTIGMARDADPDTATREFYFNVADNPKLDTAREKTGNAGYAVFGKVVRGMDVLDAIRVRPTTSRPAQDMQDVPVEPVVLVKVRRVSQAEALGPKP
jgi:peptidyl-prolyl cis-trans isomerase A (cyclophilin A)